MDTSADGNQNIVMNAIVPVDKGKRRAIESPSWAIGNDAFTNVRPPHSMMDTEDSTRPQRGLPPLISATSGTSISGSRSSSHNNDDNGDGVLNSMTHLYLESESRRLQILEDQDAKSRELAFKLDREERRNASRYQGQGSNGTNSYEPPRMFSTRNEGASSSSSLPSVAGIAGAMASLVGNRFSPFARATTTPSNNGTPTTAKAPPPLSSKPKTSNASGGAKLHRSSSSSSHSQSKPFATSPTSDYSNDYLAQLRRQVQDDQDARSLELAIRLQQEEQRSTTKSTGDDGRDYASRSFQLMRTVSYAQLMPFPQTR